MLTLFGQYVRKLRIDHNELLKDMAGRLGVTASYLSAVETGKRKIPENWTAEIGRLYDLDFHEQEALDTAAARSATALTLDLADLPQERRETALLFARQFEKIDNAALEEIKKLLKK